VETLSDGPERRAAVAAIGTALTAVLAAPRLGGPAAPRDLMARASWALRTAPRPHLWP
jgi:hypothetical protein